MKNKKRNWFDRIDRVLREAFGLLLRRGSPPLENPPRTPGKDHLYESRKPYDSRNPPPDREAAEARLEWRREQIADWFNRNMGQRYRQVSYGLRHGLYGRRKHTYHGQPEAVMAAAIREKKFLERWIERATNPTPPPVHPGRGRERRSDKYRPVYARPPRPNGRRNHP